MELEELASKDDYATTSRGMLPFVDLSTHRETKAEISSCLSKFIKTSNLTRVSPRISTVSEDRDNLSSIKICSDSHSIPYRNHQEFAKNYGFSVTFWGVFIYVFKRCLLCMGERSCMNYVRSHCSLGNVVRTYAGSMESPDGRR